MSKVKYISLVFLSMMLLHSCITSKKVNYLQNPSLTIPKYNNAVGYEEYKLAPSDKLYIRVYSPDKDINLLFNGNNQIIGLNTSDNVDLYTFTINEDGSVKLPIIGNLHLAGLSIRDAKKSIHEALKSEMKDDCAVDVRVLGRYFSVIGGNINGKYPITREKMNVFQAIALAGDISTFGDRSKIKILRETSDGPQVKVFDIRSKDIINSEFYYIQPNDVIYIQDVPEQFFSITSFGSALSTFFTTVSFGVLIYNIVDMLQPSTSSTTSTTTQNP